MKTKDIWMLVGSIFFLIVVILLFVSSISEAEQNGTKTLIQTNDAPMQKSQNICFVLGDDRPGEQRFFGNALSYYTRKLQDQELDIITHCRTLECVSDFLREFQHKSKKNLDTIFFVVHSNPWSGMGLMINEGQQRITAASLLEYINLNRSSFQKSELGFYEGTTLQISACGIGENKELLDALGQYFNLLSKEPLKIIAQESYVNYVKERSVIKRKEMEVFYAFYPTAYKPADLHLVRQFRNRYPDVSIDWLMAIQSDSKVNEDPIFSYRYNVPVEWEMLYPEYEVPLLESKWDELEWIANQGELMELVEEMDIPFDYFRWIIKKGNKSTNEYGEVPFIKVFGKVTVLCVLREKLNTTDNALNLNKA